MVGNVNLGIRTVRKCAIRGTPSLVNFGIRMVFASKPCAGMKRVSAAFARGFSLSQLHPRPCSVHPQYSSKKTGSGFTRSQFLISNTAGGNPLAWLRFRTGASTPTRLCAARRTQTRPYRLRFDPVDPRWSPRQTQWAGTRYR